jgi:formylglycine-generating enzyme required for sulfatase activity
MRLPTEAQWEYAARGGTDTPWFTGPDPSGLADVANHRSTEAAPHSGEAPPGSYGANAYGLYDMAGNVWEWTAGVYGAYPPGTQTQPSAGFAPGTGELMTLDLGRRTIRGGGAGSLPILLRVSNRSAGARDERPASVGVRPVLPAPGG